MPLARLDLARRAGLTQFGGLVLYRPAAVDQEDFDVAGVWRAPHEAVSLGTEAEVSTIAPALGIDLSDFDPPRSPPQIGDTLIRNGVTYRVDDVPEDGEGGADLILHRIS